MTRLTLIAAGVLLLPCAAGARQVPPAPPTPAAPPAAPAPPATVAAPLPPRPPLPPAPSGRAEDLSRLEERMQARGRLPLDERAMRDLERELARVSEEAAWLTNEDVRRIGEQARLAAEDALRMVDRDLAGGAFLQGPIPQPSPSPRIVTPRIVGPGPRPMRDGETEEGALYNSGLALVQQRQYDQAIARFDRVLAQKGTRGDGALYWKAFAQARLARLDDALATLATLRRDHPQSRYVNDAKALEAYVRGLSGQRVDPETLDANDDIKLLAINGIANTDPNRAIPLLEGVLNATNTLGIKKRALYVLALTDDPRAHQILLRYAKGAGTPELQLEAVRYLSLGQNGAAGHAELREIYASTQDQAVRRAIIDAFRAAGDKGFLVAVAKDKTVTVDLKRSAITGLATVGSLSDLLALYQQEPDPELRSQIIAVFASLGATEPLVSIARTEKDPNVRLRAVRSLGSQSTDKTGSVLVDLYGSEQDTNVRRAVIASLGGQNNAEALVAIARKETNLDLKREIVRRLSDLAQKDKIAADYLMDVIK